MQDRVARGDIVIMRVRGECNLADILARKKLDYHMESIGFKRRVGRNELCPRVG